MTHVAWIALVLAMAPHVVAAQGGQSIPLPAGMLGATRAFLATLPEDQRRTATFPFDAAERRRWGRSPAPRPGVRVGDLAPPARRALHDVLRAALSPRGYLRVSQIILNEDVIARGEAGMGSAYFWAAVYGSPADSGRWAFRFGGHHVSLHLTMEGSSIVSATPFFLGGEPEVHDEDPARLGMRLLPERAELARTLVESLALGQAERAVLAWVTPDSLDLDPRRPVPGLSGLGIPLSALTPAQRRLLDALVEDYVGDAEQSFAAEALRRWRAESLQHARFAWAGRPERPDQPHYYRLAGESLVIEYFNAGNHAHSIWRSRQDFGGGIETGAGLRSRF